MVFSSGFFLRKIEQNVLQDSTINQPIKAKKNGIGADIFHMINDLFYSGGEFSPFKSLR
jgi:hypothetical protein